MSGVQEPDGRLAQVTVDGGPVVERLPVGATERLVTDSTENAVIVQLCPEPGGCATVPPAGTTSEVLTCAAAG